MLTRTICDKTDCKPPRGIQMWCHLLTNKCFKISVRSLYLLHKFVFLFIETYLCINVCGCLGLYVLLLRNVRKYNKKKMSYTLCNIIPKINTESETGIIHFMRIVTYNLHFTQNLWHDLRFLCTGLECFNRFLFFFVWRSAKTI